MVSVQTSLKLKSLAPTTAGRTDAPSKRLLVTGSGGLRFLEFHKGSLRVLPVPSILLPWSVRFRVSIPFWEIPLKRRGSLFGPPI